VASHGSLNDLSVGVHKQHPERTRFKFVLCELIVLNPLALLSNTNAELALLKIDSFSDLKLEKLTLVQGSEIIRVATVEIFLLVHFNCNRSGTVVFVVLFNRHEKFAIVTSFTEAKRGLQLRSPKRRLVRPFASPFAITPRVYHLEEAPVLALMINFVGCKDRVCVARD